MKVALFCLIYSPKHLKANIEKVVQKYAALEEKLADIPINIQIPLMALVVAQEISTQFSMVEASSANVLEQMAPILEIKTNNKF